MQYNTHTHIHNRKAKTISLILHSYATEPEQSLLHITIWVIVPPPQPHLSITYINSRLWPQTAYIRNQNPNSMLCICTTSGKGKEGMSISN